MKKTRSDQFAANLLRNVINIAVLFCTLFLNVGASGQGAPELRVVVIDPVNARVVGAKVLLTNGGSSLEATTDERGETILTPPLAGKAVIKVEIGGFAPIRRAVRLGPGRSSLTVRLRLQSLRQRVEVEGTAATGATAGEGFSTVLTQEQIGNLPDDPEEMRKTLERLAGPGAVIRVDGFAAQRLPPKSQIASIRIRMSPYAAEDHDLGFASVDIRTRPGTGAWHGSAAFDYGGSELNARNFFAPATGPAQYRHVRADVNGPLRDGKSSLAVWFGRGFSYDSQVTLGTLPAGPFSDLVRVPQDGEREGARLLQFLSKNQILHMEFEHTAEDRGSLGQFDLPERLVDVSHSSNEFRLMDAATLSAHSVNELRLQAHWNTDRQLALDASPSVIVNGAFAGGGGGANRRTEASTASLSEDFHSVAKQHQLSAGLGMDYERDLDHDLTNANGTFIFPSLSAFTSSAPAQYTQLVGDSSISWDQWQFSAYVQDEFRLRENLSLSLGLRWEGQTHVQRTANFAPRFGFALKPRKLFGLMFRGGFGIFYAWLAPNVYGDSLRFNGINQSTVILLKPSYPDPTPGGTALVLPPTLYAHDFALRLPMLLRGSLGLERNLPFLRWTSEVRWQRGEHLLWLNDLNQPGSTGARPNSSLGNVYQVQNGADSLLLEWYTSLAADTRRFSWGVNYTLAKSRNDVDDIYVPPSNPLRLRDDWGYARDDARHRIWTYAFWHLPYAFRISLSSSFTSAMAYNVTTGLDSNEDTVFNDRPPGVARNTARGAAQWSLDGRLSWTRDLGRKVSETSRTLEVHTDPGMRGGISLDMPTRAYQIKLYVQASNFLNHPGFIAYDGVLNSPRFTSPTLSSPPRQLQMGLAFLF